MTMHRDLHEVQKELEKVLNNLGHPSSLNIWYCLQTLVGTKEGLAAWTIVIHILEGINTEGDETATSYAPQQTEAATWQPGQRSCTVRETCHYHLVAGGAAHLNWTIIKCYRLLHIHSLNCNWIRSWNRLWKIWRRIHTLHVRSMPRFRGRVRRVSVYSCCLFICRGCWWDWVATGSWWMGCWSRHCV